MKGLISMYNNQKMKKEIKAINDRRKQIIFYLQGNLPLSITPYREIADKIGITTETLVHEIKLLKERGFLRRMGAVLRQRQAGYKANAMVAWKVPPDRVDKIGKKLANYQQVSHAYLRPIYPNWPYNLYTMIHAESREKSESLIKSMAEAVGINDYEILYSEKEYKKTSMKYF